MQFSIQLLSKKSSIQDLGSHRPQGPSIIIMGGLGSLWCARARGKSYRGTQVGRAGEQTRLGQESRWPSEAMTRQILAGDKQETCYKLAQANLGRKAPSDGMG